MRQEDFQKFDRLMKRALRLSKGTVIEFINSLYGKKYNPEESTITYLNPEYPTDRNKEYADSMIEINGTDKYHIEIQMENDDTMVFRMFEYEYRQARESAEGSGKIYEMRFAEPKVIYLQHTGTTPDELKMRITFDGQGVFDYKVKTFKALSYTPEQLASQKLYLLVPFQLLATRAIGDKNLSPKREQQLLEEYDKRLESMVEVLDNAYKKGFIQARDYQELYIMIRDIQEYLYNDVPKVTKREVNQLLKEKELLWSERLTAEGEARGKADTIAMIKKLLASGSTIEEALAKIEQQDITKPSRKSPMTRR